ncbi:MAG: hypothetical protein U1F67_12070 [Rubrivivax sp.]
MAPTAQAQGSMAQCRAQMPAAAAQRLRACEEHGGCRAVLRIIDSCPALKTFTDLLGSNGGGRKVDDSVLRRTLVEAGVPANGLASCTSEFNRALCRNFLNLEDASGRDGLRPDAGSAVRRRNATPRRAAGTRAHARRPAPHRRGQARSVRRQPPRPRPRHALPRSHRRGARLRSLPRRVDRAARRADRRCAEARPGGRARSLRALDMPPCPQTLPGSTLTPQQALVAAAADVPDSSGAAPPATERAPATTPPAPAAPPRTESGSGSSAGNAANAGGDCRTALRRMEERFETIQRRRPAQADRLATQQVEIYMLTEQMGLLEHLCRGQREYDFLRPAQERLARTLQACRESASNPVSDCVPRVPW